MNEVKHTKIVEAQNSAVQAIRDSGATVLSVKFLPPDQYEVTYSETAASIRRGRKTNMEDET